MALSRSATVLSPNPLAFSSFRSVRSSDSSFVACTSGLRQLARSGGRGNSASIVTVMSSIGLLPRGVTYAVGEDLPEDYGSWYPKKDPRYRRRAGLLLHPSSFRGPHGIGDLGEEAFRFLDWLQSTGCTLWQVLPLVPPGRKFSEDGSPYAGQDANCGNTLLISLEELVKDGLLKKDELPAPMDPEFVRFTSVADVKDPLIKKERSLLFSSYTGFQETRSIPDGECYWQLEFLQQFLDKLDLFAACDLLKRLEKNSRKGVCCSVAIQGSKRQGLYQTAAKRLIANKGELWQQFEEFRKNPDISCWLEDAALFAAIDNSINALSWNDWPEPLKNRHLGALENIYQNHKDFIDTFIAQQFLFERQWQKVRDYAKKKGIKIMGDMPIYVGYHSADVWANKKSFFLDRNAFPILVSGVPPDAFSETGQLWGSPLYNWKAMEKDGFSWWVKRMKRAIDLYDEFRIDHFRGLAGYWAIPSEAKTAIFGNWKAGPRKVLFDAIFNAVGKIDIVAEDLGVITEDVVELRKAIGAPGMVVLQFAFGSNADNPHLPHNHEPDQVVYTGTHDNDTVLGWWVNLSNQKEKSHVLKYLGITEKDNISWAMIKCALASVPQTAIITMQDILCLGSSARMNIPATQFGNWRWRIPSAVSFDLLKPEAERLRDMLLMYNRL